MTALYDIATVVRSKNAGPFTLTIDLLFASRTDYDRALAAPGLSPDGIGKLYGVRSDDIAICPFSRVLAIKVTMPRPHPAGTALDTDVYGCQQHVPLARIEV